MRACKPTGRFGFATEYDVERKFRETRLYSSRPDLNEPHPVVRRRTRTGIAAVLLGAAVFPLFVPADRPDRYAKASAAADAAILDLEDAVAAELKRRCPRGGSWSRCVRRRHIGFASIRSTRTTAEADPAMLAINLAAGRRARPRKRRRRTTCGSWLLASRVRKSTP